MLNLRTIKDNYASFPDGKIIKIAREESKGLRKEVIDILISEIEKRSLNRSLINWVKAETTELSEFQRDGVQIRIKNSNCPNCNQHRQTLIACEIDKIASVIVASFRIKTKKFLCKSCYHKSSLSAIGTSFVFGWWSKRGIVMTPYIIIKTIWQFLFREKHDEKLTNEFIDLTSGLLVLNDFDQVFISDLLIEYNEDNSLNKAFKQAQNKKVK